MLLKILKPCSRVELRERFIDEPWVLAASWSFLDHEHDDTDHRSWLGNGWCRWDGVICRPPNDRSLAGVLNVELGEVDGRLLALTGHESVSAGEGGAE